MQSTNSLPRSICLAAALSATFLVQAAMAQPTPGVNFTVGPGAKGLSGSAIAGALETEYDVYIGGGGTNFLRLDGTLLAQLGLTSGDDIDAISYNDGLVAVDYANLGPTEFRGSLDLGGTPIIWHFSVDHGAIGRVGTGVNGEVTVGLYSGVAPSGPTPPEALGDYFFADLVGAPMQNIPIGDEEMYGLALQGAQPNTTDELNGLDLVAVPVQVEEYYFPPGSIFFSLAQGSPSLATYSVSCCDILTPDGQGGIRIAMPGDGHLTFPGDHVALGINPENDLDALYVDPQGVPFFSVRDLMPGQLNANPGDILVPEGLLAFLAGDGVADELVPAMALGLLDTEAGDATDDNLDALDAMLEPFPVPEEPPEGIEDYHPEIPEPPVPDFSAAPRKSWVPFQVTFTNLTQGQGVMYEWDFDGDGAWDSTDVNPTHTYTTAGVFNVTLQAENAGGVDTVTKDEYIVVLDPAHGVNFTVEPGAMGLLGTAVNNDADPEDDVYKGGGSNNLLRLDGVTMAQLGLVAQDDIDAIAYGDPGLAVDYEQSEGFMTVDGQPVFWHFSVDEAAQGMPSSFVRHEVTTGTAGSIPANPPEAFGDYFFADPTNAPGMNHPVADEEFLGLQVSGGPPHTEDDLNGLDLVAQLIHEPSPHFQPGQIYFSLRAGSPSLAIYGVHQADILTPDGQGGLKIAVPGDGVLSVPGDHASLGIGVDCDLDALFVDRQGMAYFSVDALMPAQRPANPGDILVPDGVMAMHGGPDGVADQLIPAGVLGLLDTENGDPSDDNLDALDAENAPIPPPLDMPPEGMDQHAEDPNDSDGDGIPNDWETANGLDPHDPSDAARDPDKDGLNNLEEYNNQTDPHDPDSDNDGATDGDEVHGNYGQTTDPNNPDSDGDGHRDLEELLAGTDANDPAEWPGHAIPTIGVPWYL